MWFESEFFDIRLIFGVSLLAVYLIIISLEVYFFQRPNRLSTLIMVVTLLMFVAAFVANLYPELNVVNLVITLLGMIMGIAFGLIMTQNGNNGEVKEDTKKEGN